MDSLMVFESSTGVARNVETTGIDEIGTFQPSFEAMFGNGITMVGSDAAMKGAGIAMTGSDNATGNHNFNAPPQFRLANQNSFYAAPARNRYVASLESVVDQSNEEREELLKSFSRLVALDICH
ncbi:hypothetical protein Syun_006908 [Stephania yunnanensis]|uniref:Uncharacterized protein n=1 Tax=Stephania yunnanensis TaxID=152371 RepID=A0AAP0PY02_9MAGN